MMDNLSPLPPTMPGSKHPHLTHMETLCTQQSRMEPHTEFLRISFNHDVSTCSYSIKSNSKHPSDSNCPKPQNQSLRWPILPPANGYFGSTFLLGSSHVGHHRGLWRKTIALQSLRQHLNLMVIVSLLNPVREESQNNEKRPTVLLAAHCV